MGTTFLENVYENKDTASSRLRISNSETNIVCWEIQSFNMQISYKRVSSQGFYINFVKILRNEFALTHLFREAF